MTSAVIVAEDELYELERIIECANGYQPLHCDDQIIIVRDLQYHTIGFIMQGDLHTLWLGDNDILSGDCFSSHVTNGKLYSDDPDRDGIDIRLYYAIVKAWKKIFNKSIYF